MLLTAFVPSSLASMYRCRPVLLSCLSKLIDFGSQFDIIIVQMGIAESRSTLP